jgi:hypothetical protein
VAASIVTPVILTACGGSAAPKTQIVQGAGFRFEAPASWDVQQRGEGRIASSGLSLAEVLVYSLVKSYTPAKFPKAAAELDARATQLAGQLPDGRVAAANTVMIAGRRSRKYQVDFSKNRTEEFGFVLAGRTEYFVLCRRHTNGPDADCARLFSSFSLG